MNEDELERLQEDEDMRWISGDPRGRRFLVRLLDYAGVYRTSWTPSAQIHYNEGKRAVGLWHLNGITNASEENYIDMLKENMENIKLMDIVCDRRK